MKTIELLDKLVSILKQNPETISNLDMNEVKDCVLEEWDNCKLLYTNEQYVSLSETLHSLCHKLSEVAAEYATKDVVDLLTKISLVLSFIPNPEEAEQKIYQANLDHEHLRHVSENTTVVLGDSHVNFFSGNEMLTFLPIGTDFNICPQVISKNYSVIHMGPCLAYTCCSDSSTFEFKKKLSFIEENFIVPNAHVIVSLGEIDLRVHVLKQAELQKKEYTEVIDDILSRYEQMLLSLKEKGYQVAVWGPIATQSDLSPVDPRFPRFGSEQDRNKATKFFNDQLAVFCQKNGIDFYTIFYNMITDDFHTRTEYLSPDHFHLGQKAWKIFDNPPV